MRPRSLSPTEARVVLALEEAGEEEVDLATIERLAHVRRGYARKIAHGLAARHWLERVGRGRYLLNPSGYGPEATPETDPLRIGSHLVRPYYLGYATAAELWGLLLRPGRTYYVVTPTRASVQRGGPATFRLVRVAPGRFFGSTELKRRGLSLQVSDRERTVLDCLERPEFAGGLAGAAQVLASAKPELDWRRLARYLVRFGNLSLVLRLGLLLERVRPSIRPPARWLASIRPAAGEPWVPLGPPGEFGRTGPRDARWRVILNVPEPELLGEAEAA
jgi:predicted transcriptional regulator of viral defense system